MARTIATINVQAQSISPVFGTGVMFSLATSQPVDIASTWIASASGVVSLFLKRHTEAASESGLAVAAECLHTGGGQPVKLLRRKIQGLLPATAGEPLILNFSGVKTAASSFPDELLGRLATEDRRGQAVANVVVVQRLNGSNGVCLFSQQPWRNRDHAQPHSRNRSSLNSDAYHPSTADRLRDGRDRADTAYGFVSEYN